MLETPKNNVPPHLYYIAVSLSLLMDAVNRHVGTKRFIHHYFLNKFDLCFGNGTVNVSVG